MLEEGRRTFHYQGGEKTGSTMAVPLEYFLKPDSFTIPPGQNNPLVWIRVNNEYLGYYFEGENSPAPRSFGVIGDVNVADEITRLFSLTSSTTLPPEELINLRSILNSSLSRFPKMMSR